jgi:hypothetical protein
MGQEQLDTKALELASMALARIDSHERLCTERYEALDDGIGELKTSLQQLNDRSFYLLLSLMGVLIGIIGYFITHFLIK